MFPEPRNRPGRRSAFGGHAVRVFALVTACSIHPAHAQSQPPPDHASPSPAPTEPPASAPQDPGLAEQARAARAHFDLGVSYFERQNFEAALSEFQDAYAGLAGHPRQYTLLRNIAQCQERLFRYDLAAEYYRRFLAEGGPSAVDREPVQQALDALTRLLSVLHVRSDVPLAEVWLDSRRIGTAPGDFQVPAGQHVVELRAPGYLPGRQEVVIASHQERQLSVHLEPVPRRLRPAPFAVSVGIASAFFIAGASVGIAAFSADAEIRARLSDPVQHFSYLPAQGEQVHQLAVVADVLAGAGIVFAVTSGVLYIFTDFRAPARRPGSSAWGVSPAGFVWGRF